MQVLIAVLGPAAAGRSTRPGEPRGQRRPQGLGAGDRLATAMSTEGQVSNENLVALTDVLSGAALPLDFAAIEG